MTGAQVVVERDAERERRIAEALRAEWRMFERVSVRPCADGDGFEATILLNQTLVRGAAEQQGLPRSPASVTLVEARRRRAIASCVESLNRTLPRGDSIRGFEVIGWGPSAGHGARPRSGIV